MDIITQSEIISTDRTKKKVEQNQLQSRKGSDPSVSGGIPPLSLRGTKHIEKAGTQMLTPIQTEKSQDDD